MNYLKTIEAELIKEWQALQNEKLPKVKEAALKAYYKKFRLYQSERDHCLRLYPGLPGLQEAKLSYG